MVNLDFNKIILWEVLEKAARDKDLDLAFFAYTQLREREEQLGKEITE